MVQSARPLPASTVVLVRPQQPDGFEVLLHRRPDNMATYAGTYVFPGGCVEKQDFSSEMLVLTRGLTPAQARATLESDQDEESCLGHWVAAARELFEEAGIHFFVDRAGRCINDNAVLQRLVEKRRALQHGELNLATLLVSEQLTCELSRFKYIFHRITPEHYKVRFDTRFYVAVLPEHQSALTTSEEVAESIWLTPDAALAESTSGRFTLMPPTIMVLRTLARYSSWYALCEGYSLQADLKHSR
jgi:8-oxo-dGTP pyrophosphatase MutT (NUDIX family)